MAYEITVTAADVRAMRGAKVRRAIAASALTFGQAVYISSYSGDLPVVTPTAGAAVATANCFGIVVAPSTALAGASVATGEACDIAVWGPVTGFSGMTSGGTVWVHNTAGICGNAVAGATKSSVIGFAESPNVLFVRPFLGTIST